MPHPSLAPVARRALLGLATCATVLAAPLASAQSPDALRGQRLYETACVTCHAESVHSRRQKTARSIADVREYVTRWAKVVNAPWTTEDVEDVATYLNERYYRFVCPAGATCKDERAGRANGAEG
jgi:mono/diheme cytochrome c family protein